MASEGGGKIRPKKTQNPSKPYDRNTSLFGKLKSSVKDLLIPSWLSSFSASKDDDTVGSSQAKPQIETIDLSCPENNVSIDRLGWTNQGLHNRSQQGSFGNSYVDMMPPKQMPAFSSVANGEVHQGVTSPATIVAPNVTLGSTYMHSLPVKNKKSDSPFMNFPERFSHKTVSNVERDDYNKRRRLSSSLTNDYEEENGQNSSVSSVMVSTGRIEQSLITSSDGDKQKSREPLRQGRPLIPPTRGKPVFNSLLFGTPSKSDQPSFHENFGESLFYSGKTQYGGSSSARRKQLNKSLPYQSSLPLRKQVRATKPKDTLNATTSTTAQRILDTLDRMSGSLEQTSRNDFGNDSTLSFTPSSYRSIFETSRRSITRPLQLPNRTPPTAQLMSTSQAELAYNRNRPMVRASEGTDSSLAVTQEPIIVVEQDEEEIRSTAVPPKASGKMKSKKFSQHFSGRENADVEIPAYPVLRTDFKLPVASVNPISLAAFNPIPITTSSHALKSTEKSTPKFTFSTPKSIDKKSHLSSGPAKSSMDEDFTFSSPLQASAAKAAGAEDGSKHSLEPAIGASPGISQGASPSFGASSVRVWESSVTPKPKAMSPGFGGASSSFKSCTKWSGSQKNESSAVSNSSPFGGIPVASSLKEGSVMDILGGGKSSFGSSSKNNGTAKLSQLPASSTGANKGGNVDSAFVPLSALFKKPAGAWDCQACYVQNASDALKCVACETSKAVSEVPKVESSPKSSNVPLSELFKKPPGSWDCDACLVRNDSNVNKCVACETPMPGQKPASAVPKVGSSNKSDNVPLSELFKKPPGSWDCDACMVRNNSNVIKCVACETPMPGQKLATAGTSVLNSKTSPAQVSNFNSTGLSAMFKQPEGSWTCDTCLVQNPPALDKCPCCETPKPGAKKNAPAAPQKIDKPLSELFKTPSGSWDCDTCLVNNNATALSCIACESPKPGLQSAGSESKAPPSSGHIDIQPGGGFTFGGLLPTTATTSGSGGFKFGGFGSSNAASSSQDSSSSLGSVPSIPGGFKFGATLPSNEPASSTVSFGMPATKIVPESISGGFKFGSESNTVKNSNGPGGFNNNTQSKKESSIITGFVHPQQEATVPPSSDAFKFGSSTQQKTNVPSSELFKFGGGSLQETSTSTSVSSNQTFAKPNLTFGASTTSSDSSTTKASSSPFVFGTPISTQNSFGMGTFGSAPASSPIVNGVPGSSLEKSTSSSSGHVGFGVDMEAPKAKMAFTNQSNPESATNGGFSFNAPTSGFGAKAATPAGGFNFAANPSTTPTSAFQFSASAGTGMTAQPSQSSSSNGFSFTAPSKSINSTDNGNNNNGNANFNPAPSFNFGNDNAKNVFMFGGQSATAPPAPVFQFGGNPSNPVVPQLNASAGAPAPSFSMGSGNTTQRKMKKAVRRIKK